MKLVWIEWKLSDYPWVVIGWWVMFLFCLVMGSWYIYWLCCVPYWSFEPVMKKYQFFHRFFGNVPWKRVGHSKYYCDSEVITFSFGDEVLDTWSVANEEERREVCEKWFDFMKRNWCNSENGKETVEWNVYLDEVWNGIMGSNTCLSCYTGVSRSGYENVMLGERKEKLGTDASKVSEMGWVVSQPIWFWKRGGIDWNFLGFGVQEKKGIGMERLWNTENITVSYDLDKKEKQSVTRRLFTTHHSRLIFSTVLGMGYRGIGNVNGGLFRERVGMSMCGVVPLVRFPVYEVEMFDRSVVSKREMRKTAFLGRMVALNETVLKDMKVMRSLIDWYGNVLSGGVQGMGTIAFMTWEMLIKKIKYGFLVVFVWFSSDDFTAINAIYFYRDEKRYILMEGEVQGMDFSGKDTIRWLATWNGVGLGMEMLVTGFQWSLRELVRVKKTYRILLVDGLGLNYVILNSSEKEMNLNRLGVLKGEWVDGYYTYNRFYGECMNLSSVFMLI